MIFLKIFELVFGIIVLYVLVTQFIFPLIIGTQFLPIFKRQHKIEKEITKARQQMAEYTLEKKLFKLKPKEDKNETR